ncbi:MAG: hypothetical protein ACOY93_21880 [Bacillota bacterium]
MIHLSGSRPFARIRAALRTWFWPPSGKPWSPLAINIHLSLCQWRQTLRQIDAEPDLHRKQEMVRLLSTQMNRAYWRWRIGKRY